MERYRHLLLLGAALVVALFASVIAYRVLQRRAERTEALGATQQVAVAAVSFSPGMEIHKEMVNVAGFLAQSMPVESVFTNPAELEGRVVLSPVQVGEPIFRSRVTGPDSWGAGVSALVAVGKRAMAVKVDKVIGVSGFIRPQNRVDILVTIGNPSVRGETITKIVLENMLVLAAGTELEKKPGAEKAVPVDVITLEATPEEAEKLTLAAVSGRIQLAMRNLKDKETVRTTGITVASLLGLAAPVGYESPPPPQQPARRNYIPSSPPRRGGGPAVIGNAAANVMSLVNVPAAPGAPPAAGAPAAAPNAAPAAPAKRQFRMIRGMSENVVNINEGQE